MQVLPVLLPIFISLSVFCLHGEVVLSRFSEVRLAEELKKRAGYGEIIGSSKPMQKVFDRIAKVAQTDVVVVIEGELLDVQAVRQLATIPDKPVLYSMLAAAVAAPVTQVASLLNELLAGVARAVSAVAEKQGGDEE